MERITQETIQFRHGRQSKNKRGDRQEDQAEGKTSAACAEIGRRYIFLTVLEPPPGNCRTKKTKKNTLENGAESSSFPQEAKVLETHLVKINKPNGQMEAAP